jgi:hypothetical protein
MKTCRLILLIALTAMSLSAQSAGTKEKDIVVPNVDVPEQIMVQPTPDIIHQEAPIDQPCSACHNPSSLEAEFKAQNHFFTTRECDKCHLNKSWFPLRVYQHLSGKYKPNSSPQDCESCHTTNNQFIAN